MNLLLGHFFVKGQKVPAWLQHVETENPYKFTFDRAVVVYVKSGRFIVHPLFTLGPTMRVEDAEDIAISGKLPSGELGVVTHRASPLIRIDFLIINLVWAVAYFLK